MPPKIFSAAHSVGKDWRRGAEEAARKAKEGLDGRSCDAAVFFISESYGDFDPGALSALLSRLLGCPAVIGCNSSGIIGKDAEVEMEPAMSLLAMHLPEVKAVSFSLSEAQIKTLGAGTDLVKLLDVYPTDKPNFICLGDPMSCDIDKLLGLFNEGYPGRPVVGGLASGAAVGAASWLALDGEVAPGGAVGIAFSGNIEFETVVSQGCRPIGEPLIVTKAKEHVLYELAGRPAFEVLREVIEKLPAPDRELARHSLFAGIVIDEYRPDFKRGDFLVRNLMGYDAPTGALMVGALLRPGQTLQFQLRDAKTSAEDLEALLDRLPEGGGAARGALVVSCCGRGRGLYGVADHDIKLIQARIGPLPAAGFFANGEIGRVGDKNYIHGYTSSLVVIK